MSGDAEQEYFADGITEDIITDLSKASSLFVVARNSAFTYRGKLVKVEQVGRDLGVRYVLEGSVRKAMNRVRITAQLVDADTGGHIWAERYDRDLTDVFGVQDEIAHSIVDALKVRLLPQDSRAIQQVPTTDVEAYQFHLRGRQLLNRHSMRSYEAARRMFARAIELDPDYAQAHAGIADCDAFRCLWCYDPEVSLGAIVAASARALELDPNLADAHASRGLAFSINGRHDDAEREFERALQRDPDLFEGHYFYARACVEDGRHEDAAPHFERAAEIAPEDYKSLMLLAATYRALGRESDPLVADVRCLERAERELEHHPENSQAASCVALALVSTGDAERAMQWAERALWNDPDDYNVLYNVACVNARLGEREQALELLARAMARAHRKHVAWLRNDCDVDVLRDDPRFEALLHLGSRGGDVGQAVDAKSDVGME